jgi:hypothetical protein
MAFFGSITGFASLAIHFRNYLDNLPKATISFPNQENANIFFKITPDVDGYNCSARCAFYVRIENQSAKPLTIVEYRMTLGKTQSISNMNTVANESYEILTWSVSNTQSASYTSYIGKQQLLPPLTIEPYGCKQGFLFFLTNYISLGATSEVPLEIISTRKTFHVMAPITVPNIPYMGNVRQDRFIQAAKNKEL